MRLVSEARPNASASVARRTLLLLLLGPALGVALPELLVRQGDFLWTSLAARPEQRGIGLLRLAHPGEFDVVALGSSVAFEAIDEEHLERCLRPASGRTLNLGMPRNPAVGCAMQLPEVLRLRPRVIVYVASRADLASELDPKLTQTYHPGVAWRLFPLGHFFEHAGWHSDGVLGWLSAIHRHRAGLRSVAVREQRRPRRGRDQFPVTPAAQRVAAARARASDERHPPSAEGPNVRALGLMARAARDAGVVFVVLQAPTYPLDRGSSGERQSFQPELDSLLEQLAEGREPGDRAPFTPAGPTGFRDAAQPAESESRLARRAGYHHIPAPRLGRFTSEDFRDATHLSQAGRRRLTEALARELRPLLEQGHAVQ